MYNYLDAIGFLEKTNLLVISIVIHLWTARYHIIKQAPMQSQRAD